jgi:hypothetical protein
MVYCTHPAEGGHPVVVAFGVHVVVVVGELVTVSVTVRVNLVGVGELLYILMYQWFHLVFHSPNKPMLLNGTHLDYCIPWQKALMETQWVIKIRSRMGSGFSGTKDSNQWLDSYGEMVKNFHVLKGPQPPML